MLKFAIQHFLELNFDIDRFSSLLVTTLWPKWWLSKTVPSLALHYTVNISFVNSRTIDPCVIMAIVKVAWIANNANDVTIDTIIIIKKYRYYRYYRKLSRNIGSTDIFR